MPHFYICLISETRTVYNGMHSYGAMRGLSVRMTEPMQERWSSRLVSPLAGVQGAVYCLTQSQWNVR